MSKSRSKGCFFGTPICIKGDGGSRTIGILDPLGTHRSRATARRPPSREAARAAPGPRSGLWHLCNTVSTMQQSTVPGPRPAKRARRMESRAAAHNLCASMRTTYTRTTQARLRHYVALTYRDPLISHRGSWRNIFIYWLDYYYGIIYYYK